MPRISLARPRGQRLTGRTGILSSAAALALCGLLPSCHLPLDVLGVDETVTEKTQGQGQPDPMADDRVEDKHPVRDPALTITEVIDNCSVTLNKSGSITRLDVVPDSAGASSSTMYGSYTQALASLSGPVMPTMEMVDAALKPFNDGLYAAVELGAEDGSDGSLINKRAVLTELLDELVTRSTSGTASEQPLAREAAAQLAAALSLSGPALQLPDTITSGSTSLLEVFASDPGSSRPVGFYTWTPGLEGIFKQDRFLQSYSSVRPGFGAFAAAALAIGSRPGLTTRYQSVLDLYAGLTNPYFHRSVLDLVPLVPTAAALDDIPAIETQLAAAHPELSGEVGCAARVAFLPPSDSAETRLFRGFECAGELDGAGSLIDLLIAKIRSGEVDLTPTADSGFYDRQLFALETLLVPEHAPEKDHLLLTRRYKEKLVESFKTLITERRETHVKQLDHGSVAVSDSASAPVVPIDVYPVLPVEPFPTFYLRTARAYAFLDGVLRASLGDAFMNQAHRVNEDGTRGTTSVGDELRDRTCLLYGLSTVAAASIGMAPLQTAEEQQGGDPKKCEQMARDWLASLPTEPDLERDPRVIVPVQIMPDNSTRAWAVIGVRVVSTEASFVPGFEPEVVNSFCPVRGFVPAVRPIAMGKQVEVTLRPGTPPPTRAELRALCDREGSVDAIVKALEAL